MEEKRRFNRIAYKALGTVQTADKVEHQVFVSDLSIHGAFLYTSKEVPLQEGDNCHVSICLDRDLNVEFDAKIVRLLHHHKDALTGIGLQCTSISLDDITTLKTLVAMNSTDPVLLERSVAELIR